MRQSSDRFAFPHADKCGGIFFPSHSFFLFLFGFGFFYYSYFSGSPQLQHSKGLDQRYFCNPSQKKKKRKKKRELHKTNFSCHQLSLT
jgi:hypothetical protein